MPGDVAYPPWECITATTGFKLAMAVSGLHFWQVAGARGHGSELIRPLSQPLEWWIPLQNTVAAAGQPCDWDVPCSM